MGTPIKQECKVCIENGDSQTQYLVHCFHEDKGSEVYGCNWSGDLHDLADHIACKHNCLCTETTIDLSHPDGFVRRNVVMYNTIAYQ